jgi:hydroxyethylthiazole kinase-like sugar kinase family protein
MKLSDSKPFSRARQDCILRIYEEAYKFKRLPKIERGNVHSKQWQTLVRATQARNEWGSPEVIAFINLIREHTRKQIRQHLLDNGSKLVRRGKRTYIRKKK